VYPLSVVLVGWAHKATLAPRPCLTYCTPPSNFLSFLIPAQELSVNYQQRYLLAKQEKFGKEMAAKFCLRSISFMLVGSFKACRKILRYKTDGFASPPKEVVLRNFIALRTDSPRLLLIPRILEPMADTLPLDHRGRLSQCR
jgi:hypothetical protein